jgi:uncharacterized ferritin-like protein (DUF455 family)
MTIAAFIIRKRSFAWQVQLVEPKKMKRLGKGGTLASRQALVHSLVHIESWAVDLSW